jgi:hypothetical protein
MLNVAPNRRSVSVERIPSAKTMQSLSIFVAPVVVVVVVSLNLFI